MISTVSLAVIPILWISFFIYWAVAARDAKTTRWREPAQRRWLHGLPLLLAAILIVAPNPDWGFLVEHYMPVNGFTTLLGTLIVAFGLGYAVWARRHLGRDWSGTITLKEDHTLVRSGPYERVRHPIYTGLLLGFAGTAIAVGEWRSLIATALFTLGMLIRCHVEEQKMRETFPEYDDYRRHSWALIPYIY
jgi:protein-S-isoprenylcysteine O-methyltransferase Ste14